MEIRAQVKKQDGSLILEGKYLLWKTDVGASETVDLEKVAGMKATPPTAASNRILLTGTSGPILKLDFPNRDALDNAKQAIQQAIQSVRQPEPQAQATGPEVPQSTSGPGTAPPEASTGGPKANSEAPSGGSQPKKKQKKAVISLEPAKLLANFELQRNALQQDKTLQKTFQETVMTGLLTNEQFWEMRLDLLVTSAQESGQARGSYNVLSTIKPVTSSDNRVNLSLTRDKIHDIFDQYPIVRKAYNDNVPNISEGEFWQKFFMSRFFLYLRGERISNSHPWDPMLDKYIDLLEESIKKRKAEAPSSVYIPMYLDVQGNVDDVPELSQAPGDPTMRIGSQDSYGPSLIRQFNGLSKRLVSGTKKQPKQKQDTVFDLKDDAKKYDAELMNQIKLTDLEPPSTEGNSINLKLHTKSQSTHKQAANFQVCKEKLLSSLRSGSLDLQEAVYYEDQDVNAAQRVVTDLITSQKNQDDDDLDDNAVMAEKEVLICQATTVEFLRHFWIAKEKNQPLEKLKECLQKSLERIKAATANAAHQRSTSDALSPLAGAVARALELGP